MKTTGFTLAELLIALAILGVIATFTIPKVIQVQQEQSFNAKAKEAVASIAGAIKMLDANGQLDGGTTFSEITQHLNYVQNENMVGSRIDHLQGNPGIFLDCSGGGWYCLRLHNGAALRYSTGNNFGGTTSTNAIYFYFDPDGQVTDGTANGPGKTIAFYIYYNGKVRNASKLDPVTTTCFGVSCGSTGPWGGAEPPWFSW